MLLIAATSRGPDGNRKPASSTAAMNLRVPTLALPANANTGPASGFRCGAISLRAALRLVEA